MLATAVLGGLVTADGGHGVIRLETTEGPLQLTVPREKLSELMFQALALMPNPDRISRMGDTTVAAVDWWRLGESPDGSFIIEFHPQMGGAIAFSLDRKAGAELARGFRDRLG